MPLRKSPQIAGNVNGGGQVSMPLCVWKRVADHVRSNSESGQSLIEFALTLPLLLLVITGLLWFGVVLYQSVSLAQAAQVATRQLVISRGQTTDPCATIATAVTKSAPNLKSTSVTYTLTLNGSTYSGASCPTAAPNMVLGATAQLKVTYPTKLVLYANVISLGFNLSAQEKDKLQ